MSMYYIYTYIPQMGRHGELMKTARYRTRAEAVARVERDYERNMTSHIREYPIGETAPNKLVS